MPGILRDVNRFPPLTTNRRLTQPKERVMHKKIVRRTHVCAVAALFAVPASYAAPGQARRSLNWPLRSIASLATLVR
jgi:hypothetical protein